MTIQMRFFDGDQTKTFTYRKVYKTKNLVEVREGFFANAQSYRGGLLIQLKGKERIILNSFGKIRIEPGITEIKQ